MNLKKKRHSQKTFSRPSLDLLKIPSLSGKDSNYLPPKQKQVYDLIVDEGLDRHAIHCRLRITERMVDYHKAALKKKGWLENDGIRPSLKGTPVNLNPIKKDRIIIKKWRYHKLHFVIKPYYFYPRYEKIQKEVGNYGINYGDWVIFLNADVVQVKLRAGVDFSNPDKWQCTNMAQESFERVMRNITNQYGFEIWKERNCNIRLVDQHLARNPSELANANEKIRDGAYLQIRGHDGKVFFTLDKSKGAEHEYVHPDRALSDSEKIEPHLNDMIHTDAPVNSKLEEAMLNTQKQLQQLIQVQMTTATQMQTIANFQSVKPDENKLIKRQDYIG